MVTRSGDALGFTLASRAMNNNDVTELSSGTGSEYGAVPVGNVDPGG